MSRNQWTLIIFSIVLVAEAGMYWGENTRRVWFYSICALLLFGKLIFDFIHFKSKDK